MTDCLSPFYLVAQSPASHLYSASGASRQIVPWQFQMAASPKLSAILLTRTQQSMRYTFFIAPSTYTKIAKESLAQKNSSIDVPRSRYHRPIHFVVQRSTCLVSQPFREPNIFERTYYTVFSDVIIEAMPWSPASPSDSQIFRSFKIRIVLEAFEHEPVVYPASWGY